MEAEKALERITPEEAGISSRQVKKCIEELMHETTQMHGFMAARHGKVFAECWWAPFNSEMVHSNHSFGKSYTTTQSSFSDQMIPYCPCPPSNRYTPGILHAQS